MREIKRIRSQLRHAFEGPAWHGPSVRELLSDVTAERAAARPIPGAHSIWEITLHIMTWERVVRLRLDGDMPDDPPDQENWPKVSDTSQQSWQKTIAELEEGNKALRDAIARLDQSRLDEIVPEKVYSFYFMLHGIIQHDLYHAGQIALLKKA
ncbi:MAG TPA: DinB family protein [Blastocatellia bacterium]|nr:DinB family protein [Blastocatellia bacterium]